MADRHSERFAPRLAAAGGVGLIIPDLPVEEAAELAQRLADGLRRAVPTAA
ncbi:hypothetical protein HET69_29910 [Streptomyces sp. CJ_13]|nr:hypothetical protein [Streptomyces sp. CJ_13]